MENVVGVVFLQVWAARFFVNTHFDFVVGVGRYGAFLASFANQAS